MTKKVYLIRHGMTEANEKQLYCGATDIPLSEAGVRRLEELRRRFHYPSPTGCAVVTSGMMRTAQTLKTLYGDADFACSPELREMDFGAFEMRSYEQLKNYAAYQEWCAGDNEMNRCPGGESGADMIRRVLSCFAVLLECDHDLLLITHGGPIAAIMSCLFAGYGRSRYEWQPALGEGYAVMFRNGQAEGFRHIPEPEDGTDWLL